LRALSISSGDIVLSGSATSAGGGSIFADSAASGAADSDDRPLAFFGEPLGGDLLPDTFLAFPAVPGLVFVSDDFVSEFASDDCASELVLDFFAVDFALPIT